MKPILDPRHDQILRLRKLAEEWRARAAETLDPHYGQLMTRTADELDAHARELERIPSPVRKKAGG